MHTVDYSDLSATPAEVASATYTLAHNSAHLASLLDESPYPVTERTRGRRRADRGKSDNAAIEDCDHTELRMLSTAS